MQQLHRPNRPHTSLLKHTLPDAILVKRSFCIFEFHLSINTKWAVLFGIVPVLRSVSEIER